MKHKPRLVRGSVATYMNGSGTPIVDLKVLAKAYAKEMYVPRKINDTRAAEISLLCSHYLELLKYAEEVDHDFAVGKIWAAPEGNGLHAKTFTVLGKTVNGYLFRVEYQDEKRTSFEKVYAEEHIRKFCKPVTGAVYEAFNL